MAARRIRIADEISFNAHLAMLCRLTRNAKGRPKDMYLYI